MLMEKVVIYLTITNETNFVSMMVSDPVSVELVGSELDHPVLSAYDWSLLCVLSLAHGF